MEVAQIMAMLKGRGWILNLVFIFASAYFAASAGNAVVGRAIRVVPTADMVIKGSTKAPPVTTKRQLNYASISARNLFDAKRENLSPQPISIPTTDESDSGPGELDYDKLAKCTMPGALRATLVADENPEWSMAVVYSNTTRETGVYSIGEGNAAIAADVTLVEVRSRAIVVKRSDRYELCTAEGEEAATPTASAPVAAKVDSKPDSKSDGNEVRKISDDEYQVDKRYFDDTLENLSKVATQARIIPSFKRGKPNGFKLFSIKPGSIFSKIGMQNGDVIQKINGYEMNSPDKALEIYQKFRSGTSISIDFQRRGKTMSRTYNIVE